MINDEIYPMNRRTIFYKCDPSRNANCSKTACQKECKFTTNAEFSGDGKKYKFNNITWEFEEVPDDSN